MTQLEPWLRGPIANVSPVAAHVLYTFIQVREELQHYCAQLTVEALWERPGGGVVASAGFHIVHIAGSLDRLTTYLEGRTLSSAQLDQLRVEASVDLRVAFFELMEALEKQFKRTEAVVRAVDTAAYADPRYIGRRKLPTTAGGLIVHLAEHTQRHLGQAVVVAQLVTADGVGQRH